ncbi:MAG: hypothetical protein LBV38_01055 [Alistipes sp.]|nr:hypothetical protein [Alistipes sp.]
MNKIKATGRMIAAAMALGATAVGTGCIEADPPSIDVDTNMFRVGAEGADLDLRITANMRWTATSDADWVQLSNDDGRGSESVKIWVDPYEEVATGRRKATLTFKTSSANPAVETVVINQNRYGTELQIDPGEYTIGAQGGTAGFTVISNTAWTVHGESDWARIEKSDGEGIGNVRITVDKNANSDQERTAIFTVANTVNNGTDLAFESFSLTQKGQPDPTIIIGAETIHFTAGVTESMRHRVAIVATPGILTERPAVDCSVTWLDYRVVKGDDGYWYVEFLPESNTTYDDRSGMLTIIIPDGTGDVVMRQIEIIQDGSMAPYLELLPEIVNLPADNGNGGSVTGSIAYASNETVEVLTWPNWITGRPRISGNTIVFTAAVNPDTAMRTGSIVVQAEGGDVQVIRTLTVVQAGVAEFVVHVTPGAANLPAADNADTRANELAFTFFVTTDNPDMGTPAVSQINGNWITNIRVEDMTLPVGKGYIVSARAQANDLTSVRMAQLQILASAGSQQILPPPFFDVTQAGTASPNISIFPSFQTVNNEVAGVNGATANSSVEFGILGAATVDLSHFLVPNDWLEEPVVSTEQDNITLTIKEANPYEEVRRATLYVTAAQGGETQTVEVTIEQVGNGGATITFDKMLYEIGPEARTYNSDPGQDTGLRIPAVAQHGTRYEVKSFEPAAMFGPESPVADDRGDGDGIMETLYVDVYANDSSVERGGEIVLLATNGNEYTLYNVGIRQRGLKPMGAVLQTPSVEAPWGEATPIGPGNAMPTGKIIITDLPEGIVAGDIGVAINDSWFRLASDGVVVDHTTATIALEAIANNPNNYPRSGSAIVTITRHDEHQTLNVSVIQEAAPGPQIRMASGTINVPANSNAGDLVGELLLHNTNGAEVTYSTVDSSDSEHITGEVNSNDALEVMLMSGPNTETSSKTTNLRFHATAANVVSELALEVVHLGVDAPELDLSSHQMFFGATEQIGQTLGFSNPNLVTVVVDSYPDWIESDSFTSGANHPNGIGYYKFNVAANPTSDDRFGKIVLRATAVGGTESVYYSVGVIQRGLSPLDIAVNPATVIAGPAAANVVGNQTFAITGIPAGAVATVKSLNGWLTSNKSGAITGDGTTKTFTAKVEANDTGASRKGTIMVEVKLGEVTQAVYVSVMQLAEQPDESVLQTEVVNVPWGHATQTPVPASEKIVISGIPAGATVATQPSSDWFEADEAEIANGIATIALNVVRNNPNTYERSATALVTVTSAGGGTQSLNVTVIQAKAPSPQVSLATDGLDIPAGAVVDSEYRIPLINANGATVDFSAVTVISGATDFVSGEIVDNVLVVKLTNTNTNAGEKRATLGFTASAGGVTSSLSLEVSQAGAGAPSLSFPSPSLVLGAPGQSDQVLNFANPNGADVRVISKPDWVETMGLADGKTSGTGEYHFRIAQSTSSEDRFGKIELEARTTGGQTAYYTVGVRQSGLSELNVAITPATVVAGSAEADAVNDQTFAITGLPEGATATIKSLNSSWLKPRRNTITGDGGTQTFTMSVTENDTDAERTGIVMIEVTRGGETRELYLSVLQRSEIYVAPGLVITNRRYDTEQYAGYDTPIYSAKDDQNNEYFVFLLGTVSRMPISFRPAMNYGGITPVNIGYTSGETNEQSVMNSVTSTVENSVTKSSSLTVSAGFELGPFSSEVSASFSESETNTRSTSNTYETTNTVTSSQLDEISATIGEHGEPAGKYRYALFATADVYYILTLKNNGDGTKTFVDGATSVCAREGSYAWDIDYDPDTNGDFGKTNMANELLAVPELTQDQYNALPNPTDVITVPVGNATTYYESFSEEIKLTNSTTGSKTDFVNHNLNLAQLEIDGYDYATVSVTFDVYYNNTAFFNIVQVEAFGKAPNWTPSGVMFIPTWYRGVNMLVVEQVPISEFPEAGVQIPFLWTIGGSSNGTLATRTVKIEFHKSE